MPNHPHTLADHHLGLDAGHAHGAGEDHDHEHDDAGHDLLDHGSRALEGAPFLSMGLDIGSAGTQVVFSRLIMRGPGEPAALRRRIKARETLYLSPIALTPFLPDNSIDIEALRNILDAAHAASGVTPDDIETGAVILTGEAARRDNARTIAEALAEESGEVICAAAGHHMEARLAAHGSGAVALSREKQARILNLDIGGGTAKLAICNDGRVENAAALGVGGRLLAWDDDRRLTRLEQNGRRHATRAGVSIETGAMISTQDAAAIAGEMARALIAALTMPAAPDIAELWLTEPLADFGRIDGVLVSGGVGEFVYGRETRDFGDPGGLLGADLRDAFLRGEIPWPLLPARECIRATVLGASEYSLQMSGQTSTITSHSDLLPRRNLPVLHPPVDFSGAIDSAALAEAIRRHRVAFDMGPEAEAAYAFRWRGAPSHERLHAFAQGIAEGLGERIAARLPLYILMEGDAALTLGAILREELGVASEMLILDGITLRDFDYVDIGRMRLPSNMVPVTVKTLLFGADQSKV